MAGRTEIESNLQSFGKIYVCDSAKLLEMCIKLILTQSRTVPEVKGKELKQNRRTPDLWSANSTN